MSDDRPSVYFDKSAGRWVYRASAIGRDMAELLTLRLGSDKVPVSEAIQAAFDEGNRAEPLVIEELRRRGWDVRGQQHGMEIIVSNTAMIRGHIDGLVGARLLEVKTAHPDTFADWTKYGWSKFEAYACQVTLYMAACNCESVDMVWALKTEDGELVQPLDLRIETFHGMPRTLDYVLDRVKQIELIAETGELPEWWFDETAGSEG